MKFFSLLFLFLFSAAAAPAHASAAKGDVRVPPAAPAWIEWDPTTERIVSDPGHVDAAYPRAKPLANGEILLAYHHDAAAGAFGSAVTLRRSRDGGATWYQTQEVEAPEPGRYWGFSNPDFIELDDAGRLLLVSAARGRAAADADDPFVSECRRSGLRLRFSEDFGVTWSEGRLVAAGRGRLWEPSLVRLADGTLEIYYANEAPDLVTADGLVQRIELIRSTDGGLTWSEPVETVQDTGCRNGMPTALALRDGTVVCAQEVVGVTTSPWIVRTSGGRRQEYYLSQRRHGFGGSPFLAHAPDGGTLLAYPSRQHKVPPPEDIPVWWMYQHIYVQHGDAEAKNFGPASIPWQDLDARTGAFFPSLMVRNDGTLVALASFITLHTDRTTSTEVRWIEGRFKPAVTPDDPARGSVAETGSDEAPVL